MASDKALLKSFGSFIRRRSAPPGDAVAATASTDSADSVERLAAGIAHDINNIMLVVRGYAELALGEQDLGSRARAHLQEVMTALGRATELVGQLLAVGRRASSSLAEIDLNEAVRRALEQVRASRPSGLAASFVAGADLPRLLASADQLEWLVEGLLSYAADRTEGEPFQLQTSLLSQEPAPGESPKEQRILLRLTAAAAEVSKDERAHLFEPFYVSPVTRRRMGLGMAAVRGIVSLLGGEISARTTTPQESAGPEASLHGIEFLITLPVLTESKLAIKNQPGGTILLAEDDVGVRDLASRVLSKEGYHVLAARDGEEAMRLFEQNRERIRIAILDDVMPKLSGRSVLERIHQSNPSLPVILCTGYAWGDQESAAQRGAREILPKPYEPRDLLRRVRRALGSGG
jgi:CheY-like chemotaxis protein